MNSYREMYEALLKDEVLCTLSGQELKMDERGEIYNERGELTIIRYTPSMWSIKSKTIGINGYEVPEPVREPLKRHEPYFTLNLFVTKNVWSDDVADRRYLRKGLIHRTEEAAMLHAKALLNFTEVLQ
jgi:hypothetical protein